MARLDLSEAYPMLEQYWREFRFIKPGVIVIIDDITAPQSVDITWLLHTLSEPTVASDLVSIVREPASMTIQVLGDGDGLLKAHCTDQFETPVTTDANDHETRQRCPNQYHLSWHVGGKANRRIVAVLAINGAEISTQHENEMLTITAGQSEMRIAIAASPF